MSNKSILQKLMGWSPSLEMLIRRLYRNKLLNLLFLQFNFRKNVITEEHFDFTEVINYLKSIGVKMGDILIVHSAFKPLKPSRLTPDQIIDELLNLVGESGTLVMPVIRKYSYNDNDQENLSENLSELIFDYDVRSTEVFTGIIPMKMMIRSNAVTSRFPLNTITAIGSDAKRMVEKELIEDLPAPNGLNSAWKYCMDRNAWVVSLGTDLTHSLTMIHTVEDVNKNNWPVRNWYRELTFKIIDGEFQMIKTVKERHPKWGMFHFGERKLCRDLLKNGIMTSVDVKGVLIEALRSKTLFDYLVEKNANGYPYYWLGKNLKK
jgi:aminoglycoside 3-N-acetyltransferase